jgi:Cytochrome P460
LAPRVRAAAAVCAGDNAGNGGAIAVSGLASRVVRTDNGAMKTTTLALAAGLIFLYSTSQGDSPGGHNPAYTAEGRLIFPADYREWVFLTAGLDMSYMEGMQMGSHHMLDNVFVNPAAYKSFLATGTWPDGTMLVKENRRADTEGSINKSGQFQTTETMGIEIHVKDVGHFPDQWAFFAFGDALKPAAMIPQAAQCYSCHAAHAAVDRTFVQFYPTLLPIATAKGTLSEGYKKDESSRAKAAPPSHGAG